MNVSWMYRFDVGSQIYACESSSKQRAKFFLGIIKNGLEDHLVDERPLGLHQHLLFKEASLSPPINDYTFFSKYFVFLVCLIPVSGVYHHCLSCRVPS